MIQMEKIGGRVYVEERKRGDEVCSLCGEQIGYGEVLWRGSGEVLHNQCFRRMQREEEIKARR